MKCNSKYVLARIFVGRKAENTYFMLFQHYWDWVELIMDNANLNLKISLSSIDNEKNGGIFVPNFI